MTAKQTLSANDTGTGGSFLAALIAERRRAGWVFVDGRYDPETGGWWARWRKAGEPR